MKNNFIYLVIYITILVLFILISFYIIETIVFLTNLPLISSIVRDFIDYTFGMKQPAMLLPNISYRIVNFYPLHTAYYVWLAIVALCTIIILILWLIGVMINRIVFFIPNPFAQISPWKELNEMGFFKWFFEKTLLDKNKDVQNFVLNIFKSVLTPQQYEEAQKRCKENFANKQPNKQANKLYTTHIDYNFTDQYIENRRDNIFYTNSFKSIKHREEADKYRNMKIVRPDDDDSYDYLPESDNVESTIRTNIGYIYI
jgi:hypothetical protein